MDERPARLGHDGLDLELEIQVEDLPRASAAVMKALSTGAISSTAAATCAALVDGLRKNFETLDLVQRIEALEQEKEQA